jgi:hypothetical protein
MSLWTRATGFRRGMLCTRCGTREATRPCDGVVRRDPWALCRQPLCVWCVTNRVIIDSVG